MFFTFLRGIITFAVLLNVMREKESFGLNFEKNIRIAYLASTIRHPSPLEFKPEPIDPETSRMMTAFMLRASRSSPSLLPFVKIAK